MEKQMKHLSKLPDGLEMCDGHLNMYRCPKCKRENYILNVTLGICTWCGYDANKDYPVKPNNQPLKEDSK